VIKRIIHTFGKTDCRFRGYFESKSFRVRACRFLFNLINSGHNELANHRLSTVNRITYRIKIPGHDLKRLSLRHESCVYHSQLMHCKPKGKHDRVKSWLNPIRLRMSEALILFKLAVNNITCTLTPNCSR